MNRDHSRPRVEWERRFLLERFPHDVIVTRVRYLDDRYIEGTNLRLRRIRDARGQTEFRLTQKLPADARGARQGLITTIVLNQAECHVLTGLPAMRLAKTRHSVPPFGIDVFEGELSGLILAEAEFNSDLEASALVLPRFVGPEITNDVRFTGGRLAAASRGDLAAWLADFGMRLNLP